MVVDTSTDKTEVGNYFISNYPPYSFWKPDHLDAVREQFGKGQPAETPLGLYLHIPFCRKRCKFCYFKVYTDVNADAIGDYVDALTTEVGLLSEQPAVAGRTIRYAYFGGGTPSYLAAKQLNRLAERLHQFVSWDQAEEVTFECEPGTLSSLAKVQAIRDLGVTRLSLGIENFSDEILEENGRAHLTEEVYRSYDWIRQVGFDQVNIDLISGMVGETWDNWKRNIEKTIEMDPDAVTIYQMELPHNTRYTKELSILGQPVAVANWSTKRDWVKYAQDTLSEHGYEISSAYTMVKKTNAAPKFLYRDNLWHGADLLAAGVASFGHMGGVHYQNVAELGDYQETVGRGELPLGRGLPIDRNEALIREMILQLKCGWLDLDYFRRKFDADILSRFSEQFDALREDSLITVKDDRLLLDRQGLLKVDSLLPAFFKPEHRSDRYT